MLRMIRRGESAPSWTRPADMPEALYRLLAARGVASREAANAFLHPSKADVPGPSALQDMDRAACRIREAVSAGERICVWGDYDVDGVCATAILLRALKRLGARADYHIPSRHGEGYGLSEPGVTRVAEGGGLLVTVDCGVTSAELIARAQARGLSFVVTDHHRMGDELPDCPVVSPLLGDYPNPGLCGAGVAFKLALALNGDAAWEDIDLAALATIADVVPLTGENRALAALGIDALNRAPRPGVAALLETASVAPGAVNAGAVAFQLAPRLNAGGRVGSAVRSLNLLLSPSLEEARPLAKELEDENTERRRLEAVILKDADEQMRSFDFAAGRVIVLAGEDWNQGVVGLAASRLVERYTLPTVLLARNGDDLVGSCRSIPGVDIHRMLARVSGFMTRFGGHKQAAGLTMPSENLIPFREALNREIAASTEEEAFVPFAEYDLAWPIGELDGATVHALAAMEPTGCGNPAPLFLAEGILDGARAIGRDGAHLSFQFHQDGAQARGVSWRRGGEARALNGRRVTALYAPKLNVYQNRANVEIEAKYLAPAADESACPDDAGTEALLHRFLTRLLYNRPIPADMGRYAEADYGAIARALAASPRGTLIIATTREAFRAVLAAAPEGSADAYVGRWPDDPRLFNALCLLPEGDMPCGYARVYCPDLPGAWFGAPSGGFADWTGEMPDKDGLRALYVAVRALLKKPYAVRGALALSRDLAELSGLTALGAHAGLCALSDLKLIEWNDDPARISQCPVRRVEPETSGVFRALAALNRWGRDSR